MRRRGCGRYCYRDWDRYDRYYRYEYEDEYDYLEEIIKEEMLKEMNEYDDLRINSIRSKMKDEFDSHIKLDRHSIIVKGIMCRSGRTVRPVGRGNGCIVPNKVSDDSRQHPSRLLRVRKVRQCDCCRTHRCEHNIPVPGRKINVNDYIEDDN